MLKYSSTVNIHQLMIIEGFHYLLVYNFLYFASLSMYCLTKSTLKLKTPDIMLWMAIAPRVWNKHSKSVFLRRSSDVAGSVESGFLRSLCSFEGRQL